MENISPQPKRGFFKSATWGCLGLLFGLGALLTLFIVFLNDKSKPISPQSVEVSRQHVEQFRATFSAPEIKVYIANVTVADANPDNLKVTVTQRWHYQPKAVRLQMAQMVWKAWAAIHSPTEPDTARITLRDTVGNEVGGSKMWGGSFIWVND
ncbi:MAG: hypothetical protein JNJ50_05705 [Acidobacteria bacterium]|nr:hypothetical protein [Acidobacteriota bacterium]